MDDIGVVRRLRDAAVRVASDLELEAVLRNVVEAAAGLLDARYAALGVIGEDRFLSEFIHTGFDGDIERIGHLPEGHGILGLLIHDAQTLRLEDLTAHPQSVGFPDGHPAMRSFLGVPVRVRDAVYGNLYLTEKRNSRTFTEADEQLATALAAAAGAAIDNAFLYRTTRMRERSLDAMAEISGAMLSGASDARVLELIAERARELIDADLAVICVPRRSTDGQTLTVRAAAGVGALDVLGSTVAEADALAGEVMRRGRLVAGDWTPAELTPAMSPDSGNTAVGVPLRVAGATYGALALAAKRFGDDERRLTETFANQASVMIEYSRAKHELERLALIEERERIGRDLHDTVIQRLFATGLELQALASRRQDDPELVDRVTAAIDGLDDTITQIRATIFALKPPGLTTEAASELSTERVHGQVVAVIAESARALGFEPDVTLIGDDQRAVPTDIAEHVLVVVREALSNVARHASATAAAVEVQIDDAISVTVSDNGVGMKTQTMPGGYGLQNLRERARAVGGQLDVLQDPAGGTVVRWSVHLAGGGPLPDDGPARSQTT